MSQSAAVIGDVHGDAEKLRTLLSRLSGRRIVFLGDVVNRGPDTRSVLDMVLWIVTGGTGVLVAGNHEAALLRYWRGESSFVEFALAGGIPTLRSYLPVASGDVWTAFRAVFPDEHRVLLERAVDEVWLGDALVKHWDMEAERALETNWGETTRGRPLIVGHRVQQCARRIGDVVFLDSGSGKPGGELSAFLLPEQTFISTNDGTSDQSPRS